jgi:hypothetical protein
LSGVALPNQIVQSLLNVCHQRQEVKTGTRGVSQAVECLPSKCLALSSNPSTTKASKQAGYMWLMPVIPATQEAEIRRIVV